ARCSVTGDVLLWRFPTDLKFDLFRSVTSLVLDADDGAFRDTNSFVGDLYDELLAFLQVVGESSDLADKRLYGILFGDVSCFCHFSFISIRLINDYRFPRRRCSSSIETNNALKFPLPKPLQPLRCKIS